MLVIGLISGTSADGVEAVLISVEGAPPRLTWRLLKHVHVPHEPSLRAEILVCADAGTGTVDRVCALNARLGEAFAVAARNVAQAAQVDLEQVALIGSHGQTVWHIPEGSTLQIGEPAVIAERTGVTTVSSFRARDMAAGGQGAPLVAFTDVLLLTDANKVRAAQNIGGIGNVTFLPPASDTAHAPFAFDTGPGNMVMDDFAGYATAGKWGYDQNGELARRGRVNDALLDELLLRDPFIKLKPPKTTGRELYNAQRTRAAWEQGKARGLSNEDLLATATAFTARSIALAYRDFLPVPPEEVIVSGGGAHNPALISMLREDFARILPAAPRLLFSTDLGLAADAKEAIAFALLAHETVHGRSGNLPSATGAKKPVVLGSITPGRSGMAFPVPNGSEQVTHKVPSSAQSQTEEANPATEDIDALPTLEMVRRMNAEDARVAPAVSTQLEPIARAIDGIAERMKQGGRLIYAGAGTSGRLGVLDASEMPPTFRVSPDRVVGMIAGGMEAVFRAVEGAEDDAEGGRTDMAKLAISPQDSVVGLTANGSTPYVVGALQEAKSRGALTVSVTCNADTPASAASDISIAPLTGSEVIAGSTRLKAGTAEKLVLNMLSTGVMVRLGKTYGNLMVDVQPTNAKLKRRARRIIQSVCGLDETAAQTLLDAAGNEVKTAIVMALTGVPADEARVRLERAGGVVRNAVGS